jgi:hypothetical protein
MRTFSDFVNYTPSLEPITLKGKPPKVQDQTVKIRPVAYADFVQQVIHEE